MHTDYERLRWNAPFHRQQPGLWIAYAIDGTNVLRRQWDSYARALYIVEAPLDTSKPYPRPGEDPPVVGTYRQTPRTDALTDETCRRRGMPGM